MLVYCCIYRSVDSAGSFLLCVICLNCIHSNHGWLLQCVLSVPATCVNIKRWTSWFLIYMHFHLLSSSWLLRACCCVLVLGLTEKYACLPWWLGGSSKNGPLDGSCYLFLLQIEYGQTLLVDCWSVTPCWRWCHIRQARSDKQVVWWRIHCSVLSCICNDASTALSELAGRDRFAEPLIVF